MQSAAVKTIELAATDERRLGGLAWNAAVATAWLWLFAPTLLWLGGTFSLPTHRANLGLLSTLVGLLLRTVSRSARRPKLQDLAASPALRRWPLSLALTSGIAYAAAARFLGIHILGAVLFGLCTYGLLGLWLDPTRFRQWRAPSLLAIAVLPFADQADAYLGFGARLLTAQAAARALGALQVATLPASTLLFLDNGIASVDVPCSGVRSLWMGAVFLLGATVIERRRVGLRWTVVSALLAALLLLGNTLRVAAIVYLDVQLGLRTLAEVLHAPIGVLTFAGACAVALWLLRGCQVERPPEAEHSDGSTRGRRPRRSWALHVGLIAGVFALRTATAWGVTGADSETAEVPFHLTLPRTFDSYPLSLTPAERFVFGRIDGAFADKRAFSLDGMRGELLVVYSPSFRAHHPPEACLAAAGVRVDAVRSVGAGPRLGYRIASLDGGRRTALYWYQSHGATTASLLARIFDEVRGRERRWAQVSMLIDAPPTQVSREGRDLFEAVRAGVSRALDEVQR